MKSLLESIKEQDQSVINLLKVLSTCGGESHRAYYQKMSEVAESVDIVNIKDVVSPKEIENILRKNIEKKGCYRNAFVTLEVLEGKHDVKYCEGYLNFKGLPILHAFCKIDGKYVDPTMDLAHEKLNEDTYVLIGEYTLNEVREVIVEQGYWGEIFKYNFFKNYKENIKEVK